VRGLIPPAGLRPTQFDETVWGPSLPPLFGRAAAGGINAPAREGLKPCRCGVVTKGYFLLPFAFDFLILSDLPLAFVSIAQTRLRTY
jgi:hypothetical protein